MAARCSCGKFVVERTAWTKLNAGRRFLGCVDSYNGCGFFKWVDAPLCSRSVGVINGLLRKIDNKEEEEWSVKQRLNIAEEEMKNLRKQIRKWKLVCFFVTVTFIVLNLNKFGHVDLSDDM